MKRMLFLTILLCAAALLLAEDPIALSLKVQGTIDWNHAGKMTPLIQGKSLFTNDNLVSGKDSYASIKFIDGSSLLKVFPNSSVRITAAKTDGKLNKTTYLNAGTVYSKVAKKTGVYEVESPKTIASVKGTEFMMMVRPDGYTELYTFNGKVKLTNREGGSSAEIGPNEKGVSDGSGPVAVSRFTEADLPAEVKAGLEDVSSNSGLEIEMKGPDGDTRKVKVEFE
jgi:hypothetical protein